eukprot:jgi/Galph1/2070/GphlegSOOS_G743.1
MTTEPVEYYLESLRSADSLLLGKVVQQLLEDRNVHVFGEFLQEPALQQLKENSPDVFHLLEVFAFGTWKDGQDNAYFFQLNEEAKRKLKRLTLVDIASKKKQLEYSYLMDCLELESLRQLEDLIIECIELQLIRGKLDQKEKRFQVDWTMGRDVGDHHLQEIIDTFREWESHAGSLLLELDSQIEFIQEKDMEFQSEKKHMSQQVEEAQRQVREQQLRQEQEMEVQNPIQRIRRDKRAKRKSSSVHRTS